MQDLLMAGLLLTFTLASLALLGIIGRMKSMEGR